ncbi:MAG: hypothetical protein AAF639_05980 [Chloroflexota bacterium]
MTLTITRLSNSPSHHFYGYYGICPWNATNRYHLAIETNFHERTPVAQDSATIGLIDVQTNTFVPYAQPHAFNLQQGSIAPLD